MSLALTGSRFDDRSMGKYLNNIQYGGSCYLSGGRVQGQEQSVWDMWRGAVHDPSALFSPLLAVRPGGQDSSFRDLRLVIRGATSPARPVRTSSSCQAIQWFLTSGGDESASFAMGSRYVS